MRSLRSWGGWEVWWCWQPLATQTRRRGEVGGGRGPFQSSSWRRHVLHEDRRSAFLRRCCTNPKCAKALEAPVGQLRGGRVPPLPRGVPPRWLSACGSKNGRRFGRAEPPRLPPCARDSGASTSVGAPVTRCVTRTPAKWRSRRASPREGSPAARGAVDLADEHAAKQGARAFRGVTFKRWDYLCRGAEIFFGKRALRICADTLMDLGLIAVRRRAPPCS